MKKSILTNRKQEFVSATFEQFNGNAYVTLPNVITQTNIDSDGNQRLTFKLGNINDKVRIKIKVKIDSALDMNVGNRFQNLV